MAPRPDGIQSRKRSGHIFSGTCPHSGALSNRFEVNEVMSTLGQSRWSLRIPAAVVLALSPTTGLALRRPEMATMSAGGDVCYATSKSGLAESNDTGLITTYGLHVFAGDSKNLSVHLEGSSSSFAYELNDTIMTLSDLVFSMRTYFSIFYVGGFAGTFQAAAKRANGDEFDAFGTVYGGNLGALIDLNRDSWLGFDAKVSLPNDIKESSKQDVTFGMRTEGRIFISYDVTRRFLDVQAGLMYSTQEATFLGTGKGETISAPFLGIRMNSEF